MFEECEKQHVLHDTFFHELLIWLSSDTGFSIFKNVFTGADLKNNTYLMPKGYDQKAAKLQFRSEGVILQFNFKPYYDEELEEDEYRVTNLFTIFPYIPETKSLIYYYQYLKSENEIVPPTIPIFDPGATPATTSTVKKELENIRREIKYSFNIPAQIFDDGYIVISHDSLKDPLYYSPRRAQPVKIEFLYDFQGQKKIYIDKTVYFYLTR